MLQELNGYLATRTYLVSDMLTIADVVLYFTLQNAMVRLPLLVQNIIKMINKMF